MSETKKYSKIDLIRGDPKKAINKLSIPIILSMLLIMAYNVADSIWVAGLGADALAALGFITPVFMIIIGIGNGIGSGANSLIARAIGAKNKARADSGSAHTIIITIIISILTPIILVPLLEPMLSLMGAGNALHYGMEYGTIVFSLVFVFLFSSVLSAILRSEGDVNRATIAMAVTAVLNIILDPIFIYVFNMGISGAGYATVISAGIACLIMIYWIWIKKNTYLNVTLKGFKFSKDILIDILRVAIPNTAETFIMSILAITVNGLLVMVGTTDNVAVYTATMRIIQMSMVPLIGIGTALLTVAGAAFGARDGDKLDIGFKYSVKVGFALSFIMGIGMFIFAPQLAFIFSYSASTAYLTPQIADLLKIFWIFTALVPFGMMAACTFQGVGKGTTSLIITFCRSLLFEIICAYTFGILLGFGVMGIYNGIVIGSTLGTILGFVWIRVYINKTKKRFNPTP